jgi:dsRNA-specific ribonuclease
MKRLRLLRWSGTVLSPRTRPRSIVSPYCQCQRWQSASPAAIHDKFQTAEHNQTASRNVLSEENLLRLPSPPIEAALSSAKLAALHARLQLPSRLPLQTLARTLVDPSADSSPRFNNKPLSVLGHDLLGYYTSEYIICQYPRLPLAVVFAAMYAYVGPKALAAITREWGVELAAHPGGEVDPGFLQFQRVAPESDMGPKPSPLISTMPDESSGGRRRGISSRTVYNDEFGDIQKPAKPEGDSVTEAEGVAEEKACTNFVRALMGALYLHSGRTAAKSFFREHFMSRQLNVASLFNFRHPQRDLSRLCAREGFQPPVARAISETGRKSRHPVFVIGVFSGNEKLGEGAGSSLDEARTCAAVAALKGWYLYSPTELRVPSEMEEPGARKWDRMLVDPGDIVV